MTYAGKEVTYVEILTIIDGKSASIKFPFESYSEAEDVLKSLYEANRIEGEQPLKFAIYDEEP